MDAHRDVSLERGSIISRRRALGLLGAGLLAPSISRAAFKVQLGIVPVNALTGVYLGGPKPWAGTDIDVETVMFQGAPTAVQAIQSGSVPAADIGYAVVLSLASRGIPIVCLAGDSVVTRRSPHSRVMVAKESPLRTVTDLRGKTVSVFALGTVDHFLLMTALLANKMDAKDVKIVPIPLANQPQALASGQVDAILAPAPADTAAEVQFGARTLAEAVDFLPYYPSACLVAHSRWVDQNAGTAKQLVSGWLKANRWIDADATQARRIGGDLLKLPPDLSSKMRLPHFLRNGLHSMAGLWNLYHMMVANGAIQAVSDAEGLMRRYFVEPAQRILLPALQESGIEKDPEVEGLAPMKLPYLPKDPEAYLGPWEKV
jgi:ABC-type nitrate/sulfonate/bicarbonate transport system substrate-binding protein